MSEIWELVGDARTIYTPACLDCGWVGEERTKRGDAVAEGEMHERGERWPWQLAPGEVKPWAPGDPTMRSGLENQKAREAVRPPTDFGNDLL